MLKRPNFVPSLDRALNNSYRKIIFMATGWKNHSKIPGTHFASGVILSIYKEAGLRKPDSKVSLHCAFEAPAISISRKDNSGKWSTASINRYMMPANTRDILYLCVRACARVRACVCVSNKVCLTKGRQQMSNRLCMLANYFSRKTHKASGILNAYQSKYGADITFCSRKL